MADDSPPLIAPTPAPTQSLATQIAALFSSPVLTAFRYALTALGSTMALLGVVAFSPAQIDHIINVTQQIGVTVGAIIALIGIVTPIAMTVFGMLSSTIKAQVAAVRAMPGVSKVLVNDKANQTLAAIAVGPDSKVEPEPGADRAVAEIAGKA